MSPEKTKELISIYPELFSWNSEKLCINLFGFECDDGWFEILKECIQSIKEICQRDGLEIHAHQIKEKYATLRVYLSQYTSALDSAIEKAEALAMKTCEICGQRGQIEAVEHRWWKTLCKNCFTK